MKKQLLSILILSSLLTSTVGAIGLEANNDKVGIGIASPTAKLEIVGDGATSATKALEVFDSTGTNSLLFVRDDGSIQISGLTDKASSYDIPYPQVVYANASTGIIYSEGVDKIYALMAPEIVLTENVQPFYAGGMAALKVGQSWQHTGANMIMNQLEIRPESLSVIDNITLKIMTGDGFTNENSPLSTTTNLTMNATGDVQRFILDTPVTLQTGQTYTFQFSHASINVGLEHNGVNSYADGQSWLLIEPSLVDVHFKIISGGVPNTSVEATVDDIKVNGALHLYQTAPSITTERLYNNAGVLYWNGAQLATGAGITTFTGLTDTPSSYNAGRILFEGASSVTDSAELTWNDANGTLTVVGDISQTGSTYETHAEQLYTTKDLIYTRDGAVGGLGVGEYTGFQAKLYDGVNDGQLVFDAQGWARVGDVGALQKIATIEETSIDGGFAYYDSTLSQLKTKSVLDMQPQLNYWTKSGTTIYYELGSVGFVTPGVSGGIYIGNPTFFSLDEIGLYNGDDFALAILDYTNNKMHYGDDITIDINTSNVGIGTYSPSGKLEVRGSGTTSATSSLNITNSAADSLLFVRDDGRVGIGTTTPAEALGIHNGNIEVYRNDEIDPSLILKGDFLGGNWHLGFDDSDTVGVGGFYISTTPGATEAQFTLTQGGNAGIGTTTPESKLEVKGAGVTSATYGLNVTDSLGSSNFSVRDDGYVQIGNPALPITIDVNGNTYISGVLSIAGPNLVYVGSGIIGLYNYEGIFYNGNTSLSDIIAARNDDFGSFHYAGNEIVVVSNRNVGIGTTKPESKLEVRGSGTTSATSSLNITDSAADSLLFVRDDGNVGIGTTAVNAKLQVYGGTGGGTVDAFRVLGNTGNSGFAIGHYNSNLNSPSVIRTYTSEDLYFTPGDVFTGVPKMVILATGNIGMGEMAPSAKLDVVGTTELNGTVTASGDIVANSNTPSGCAWTTVTGNGDWICSAGRFLAGVDVNSLNTLIVERIYCCEL